MTTIELAPCVNAWSPNGVRHLTSINPEAIDTLCGMNTLGRGWSIGGEGITSAVCLPCRRELGQREQNNQLGNYMATEGIDRCECGGTHWTNDYCTNCGAEWVPEIVD